MNKLFVLLGAVVIVVVGIVLTLGGKHPAASTSSLSRPDLNAANNQAFSNNPASNSSVNQSDATPSVKEFTITEQNYSLFPSTIAVKKGDKVRITLKDNDGVHDLKIDEFSVAMKIIHAGEQDIAEFTADMAGSFQYYCSVDGHRALGMRGTLVVEE